MKRTQRFSKRIPHIAAIVLVAVLLCGLARSQEAAPQKGHFTIYGFIVYRDVTSPASASSGVLASVQRYGIQPVDLVYEQRLLDVDKASPRDAKINPDKIDTVAKDALKNPGELVALDIEDWNRFDTAHSPALYLQVLKEFQRANPKSKVGLYGIVPQVTYGWSDDVPVKYDKLNASYKQVAEAVSYFSPSLYNWERALTDESWERAAKYAIDAAHAYDASKPVIPYITPEVTRNGNTSFLSYDQMLFRLQTLKRLGVDGCIIWTGTASGRKAGGTFDPSQGWAKAVVDFRKE